MILLLTLTLIAQQDGRTLGDRLWQRMWSGEFRYDGVWDPSHIRKLEILNTPVELVWLHPGAAFPQLRISPGRPLTAKQRATLERLLGVKIGGGTGKASSPTNVGRAINPAPGGLSVRIGDGRHQRLDLVAKGTGPNQGYRDGLLNLSEALMDAEISLRLGEHGVRTYMPVAVLRLVDRPEKAIYWRMPVHSMVRGDDLRGEISLSETELQRTLERIAADISAFEGRIISTSEFLQSYYPRRMGENTGRLRALGVVHGTISWGWGGNAGLGELVDWGAASNGVSSTELVADSNYSKLEANRRDFRTNVENILNGINNRLPDGAKVDVGAALREFDAGYDTGRAVAGKVQLRRTVLEQLSDRDLSNLTRGLGLEYAGRDAQLEGLEKAGFVGGSDPRPARDAAGSSVRREAGAAGQFAAAFLLKEAMHGRLATGELGQARFWGNLGVFTVAARATEKLPLRGLARSTIPLAVGMAAVQLVNGQFSLRDLAIATGSFLAAGAGVNLLADGVLYPMLFRAGPPGWIAAGAYTVGKLAVTLYAGEKLEAWIHSMLDRSPSKGEGVRQKVDRLIQLP